MNRERTFFCVPFLVDCYKRTKKYEMRTQTSVDNTVNGLCYEISLKIV